MLTVHTRRQAQPMAQPYSGINSNVVMNHDALQNYLQYRGYFVSEILEWVVSKFYDSLLVVGQFGYSQKSYCAFQTRSAVDQKVKKLR